MTRNIRLLHLLLLLLLLLLPALIPLPLPLLLLFSLLLRFRVLLLVVFWRGKRFARTTVAGTNVSALARTHTPQT